MIDDNRTSNWAPRLARISHKYLLQLRIWACLRRQARSDTSIVPTVRLRSPRSPSLYPCPSAQFRDNICEKYGLALVIGIMAVSSGAIFVRFAQAEAPSLAIAAYRLGLATLILLPAAWLRHRRELLELKSLDWGWLLASGLFLAVHFGAWITSLEYTSVASSVALVSTSPLWVALFAWIIWREPITNFLALGLVLALGGSILISFAEVRSAISANPFLGNALALAGALAISGYWLIGRRMRRKLTLVSYVTAVYGTAALVLLAAAMLLRQPLSGFKASTYGWLLLLALIPQLLGHSSFNWALGHLPTSFVAIATLGEPVGAAFLAFLFLGESLSWLKMAAAALILAGIYLALVKRRGTK